MNSLNIALTTASYAWKNFLNQEKYPFVPVNSKAENIDHPLIICDSTSELSFDDVELAVQNGSVAIVTSLYYSLHFTSSLFSEHVHTLYPDRNSIFAGLEALELNCYIFYIPTLNWLDKNLRIAQQKHGKGFFIILPFELDDPLSNYEIKRKKFYDTRKELPSERVALIGKGFMREALNIIIAHSYELHNLPLIKLNYYPGCWDNIFCFRIDTDFCSEAQARNLYQLCQKYEVKATWFVDTQNSTRLKECYAKFENQEIGLHCYRHLVFDDLEMNQDNIRKGVEALKEAGLAAAGFAAPYGEWNESLDVALQEYGFLYSSEFGYDYDNLPSKPTTESPWQIPVHPVSFGRLRRSHYAYEEMKAYFRQVVEHHLNRRIPVIFYYHPHRELLELIEAIFRDIKEKDIPILSMQEYAQWWQYRNSINYRAYEDNGRLLIESEFEPQQVGIFLKTKDRVAFHDFVKSLDLKELYWKSEKKYSVPLDYERINKFSWRDLLYDYESQKGKRKQ